MERCQGEASSGLIRRGSTVQPRHCRGMRGQPRPQCPYKVMGCTIDWPVQNIKKKKVFSKVEIGIIAKLSVKTLHLVALSALSW